MFFLTTCLRGTGQKNGRQSALCSKACFYISDENKLLFKYDENGMYVGNIAKQLNALIDSSAMKKIKVKTIFDWLVNENLLERFVTERGKEYKKVTEKGRSIGLYEEGKVSANGLSYTLIICDKNAQQYIVNHSNIIAECEVPQEPPEFQGKPWTAEQDQKLITMFQDGLIAAEIAKELKRTTSAIKERIVKLGLADDKYDIV